MVAMLELVWGEGFMAPGGEGNVAKMVEGLELEGRRVLDLGCGLGGLACILAGKYGAHVVATDLEPPLIDRARRWLREVEPNSAFEPAISLYALSAIRDDDPQTALEWAQRLQDEQRRHETLEKLARSWFANDPEAARAWIEGSELPEAARKRALTPRRKPRRRGDAAADRINGPG
jgi:SAM-dependent methyltransferase